MRLAVPLWLFLGVPVIAAATLPLEGLHPNVSANLEWLQDRSPPGPYVYGVLMCKYNKSAIARDVAVRAFDQLNLTADNCRSIDIEGLKQLVNELMGDLCPVPDVSFIHRVPHAGSTLLTSMLESIDSVWTWSEYSFASELSEYAVMADKGNQHEVRFKASLLLALLLFSLHPAATSG